LYLTWALTLTAVKREIRQLCLVGEGEFKRIIVVGTVSLVRSKAARQ